MASRRLSLVVLAVLFMFCFMFQGQAYCQDSVSVKQENRAVKFFKDVFNWPFNITKKGAETVGRTTKSGVMTVTDTGTSAVQAVTGKPEKIKDVVVQPVTGTVDTGYTAVEGSLKTPVEGTRETFK